GLGAELALLARTATHGPLHRCSNGPVMAAHSPGRLQAWRKRDSPFNDTPDFLSGESGHVAGKRGELRRVADRAADVVAAPRARRLDDAGGEALRVLVLAVARPERAAIWSAMRAELERSRHQGVFRETSGAPGAGKVQHLNTLLG